MNGETPTVREALAVYEPEVPETERVPPGYRQTEVGVIPEDWEVVYLSDLVTSGPKNGYSGRSEKEAEGTPTLSLAATSSGRLILNEETVKRLHETIDPRSGLFLKFDDVLVQRSNTLDLVGTTVVFDGPPEVYVYPDLMMRLRFKNNATAHWFWRYANSADGRKYFVSIAAGSTGSMPKISGEKLRKMPLSAPRLPEQRAIAAALSDVDDLISALDKLIAKKRAVKTAAMQQLLTGKQRLPGFSGEWGRRRLGDIAPLQRGFDLPNSMLEKGGYPVVYSNGILNYHAHFMVEGPGVVTGRSGTIGKVSYVEGDYWPHNTALWVTDFKGNSPKFIYHLYKSIGLNQFGTGSGVPTLNRNDIHAFSVSVPSSEEQTAIATVFSDMDAEIEALEARREKTRQIKQGMMQELLTGRTRLV